MGFAPWILLSVVEGPGRVVLASALACALALALAGAGLAVGMRPRLLDVTAIAFFGAMTVLAAVAGRATQHWLGVWAGEVSNVVIALITIGSIAARRPFTLAYARETTDRDAQESPLFLRINYVISAVWALAFLIIALAGYIGDGPLHQPDNIWTNWIIQIGLVILAIKFTGWYPEYATAQAGPGEGGGTRRRPTAHELAVPLAAYLTPVGILVTIVGGRSWWIGVALIVLGVVLSKWLRDGAASASSVERNAA